MLKPLKPELVHGSRDYYFIKNVISYEIVPVLDIKEAKQAVNVTDMSPMHVQWVKSHPGFGDEIRLAKQFCKASRVYGAESYIRGFSGHVLDILVIHYGGFEQMLKAALKWKDKEVIDPEKYYKNDAMKQLNSSKTESPIIVIDPMMKERNAAAAISYEKLERFREAAKAFLKEPSTEAFKIKNMTKAELKRRAGKDKLFILEAEPASGKEDVVGAKLLKAMEQIRNLLKFHDFIVKEADWEWDKKGKAMFWFIVGADELLPVKMWPGPPLEEKQRVENFKEKYEKTFIEKGRVCTYIKREYIKPEGLVKDVLNDKLLMQKVKKIKILPP
ncbi:TPA: hypothetical protein HA265_03760 [Candidatus Woesearchaeota archaeon]|nr:hypothetical protein [Candidatus Woesearchaeota archaeon]